MGGEGVQAEVAFEIAPNGVHVIRVVLGVVVFQKEGRTLDAVVVPLPLLETACPGEENLVDSRPLNLGKVGRRHLAAQPVHVGANQADRRFSLRGGECAEGDARGFSRGDLADVRRGDFVRCLGINDGNCLLFLVQRLHQFATEILLATEHAQAGSGAFPNLARVGAHEGRGTGGDGAVHDGEVDRQVMTLHAPTPGALLVGGAKDAHVIQFRVAGKLAARSLHLLQHLFQAHDGGGLTEAALTEAGI